MTPRHTPLVAALSDVESADVPPRGHGPVITYPSGRPCLVLPAGSSPAVARSAVLTLAVLHADSSTRTRLLDIDLGDLSTTARQVEECLRLAAGPALVAVIGGDTCRLYTDPLAAVPLYLRRADPAVGVTTDLRRAIGTGRGEVDRRRLAVRLLHLGGPWPLSGQPVWQGVTHQEVGEYVRLAPSGTSTVRWWWPPDVLGDRAQLVQELGERILSTTQDLVAGHPLVAADYSGGLDSTAVAYVASSLGVSLVGYHTRAADPTNDDSPWAERAMRETRAESVTSAERSRSSYFDLSPICAERDLEGPYPWSAGRRYVDEIAASDRARGISLHLTGFGGDSIFTPMPAQMWSLWRQEGVRCIPDISRIARRNRMRPVAAISACRSTSSFATQLRHSMRERGPSRSDLDPSWGIQLTPPSWGTEQLRTGLQSLCDDLAGAGVPPPVDGSGSAPGPRVVDLRDVPAPADVRALRPSRLPLGLPLPAAPSLRAGPAPGQPQPSR